MTTEVHVVEYRAAQVFAKLRRDAGSGEDAVAIRIRGFEVEGCSIASIQARIDVPRVVHELVLPEHPNLGDNGDFLAQVPGVGDATSQCAAQAVGILLIE